MTQKFVHDVSDTKDAYKLVMAYDGAGYIPSTKFEWYLKNHLGSTMLVYGTSAYDDSYLNDRFGFG